MEKDIVSNVFFSDNERYADIINGVGCNGIPFVKGEDLQEQDTRSVLGKFAFRGKGKKAAVKYRDLMRKTPFGMNFAMVGIENQEKIDYAVVLRVMGYDVAEYERQASAIRKKVRKDHKGLTDGEYLYGFRRNSRLFPTVTFILYYGEEEWNGARDLHGILDFTGIPEFLKDKVSNYQIHVIEVRKLQDTSIFKTDVKQVFDCIRLSKDKDKLWNLIQGDAAYKALDEEACDMVAAYVGSGEKMLKKMRKHKKGGKVDMCQGLKDLLADERAEGKAEGKAEAVIDLLSDHGPASEPLKKVIMKEKDVEVLRRWLKMAATAESIEELQEKM